MHGGDVMGMRLRCFNGKLEDGQTIHIVGGEVANDGTSKFKYIDSDGIPQWIDAREVVII